MIRFESQDDHWSAFKSAMALMDKCKRGDRSHVRAAHFFVRKEAAPLMNATGSRRTQWAKDVQKLCKGSTYKTTDELYGPNSAIFHTCLASFSTCLASSLR